MKVGFRESPGVFVPDDLTWQLIEIETIKLGLTFVDLFSGCGGLSLGFLQEGYQGLLAIEKNASAFQTYKHNLLSPINTSSHFDWVPNVPVKHFDISELMNNYSSALKRLRGNVDLLVGGPPCQGFSVNGLRRPKDPRNRLYEKYVEFVQSVQPSMLLLENVEGIDQPFIRANSDLGVEPRSTAAYKIRKRLERIGYASTALRLNASDYGVPQHRPRFFIIGIRGGSEQLLQSSTTREALEDLREAFAQTLGGRNAERVTVRQAISDLELVGAQLVPSVDTKGFQQLLYRGPKTDFQRSMRLGMNNSEPPNSLRLPRHNARTTQKFLTIQERSQPGYRLNPIVREELAISKHRIHWIDRDMVSPTITTLPDDFIHYSEPRILTVRECARIQSFPDWFEFLGNYTTGGERRKLDCPRYTQVGNAVPPRMAQFLATFFRELNRQSRLSGPSRVAA